METVDDETTNAAIDFMQHQVKAGKPFFVWMNTTRMHVFTHVRPEYQGKSGMPGNEYADGMWEHDQDVGLLLKALDDLKIADDTIVVYTTDTGPNMFSWPDGAMTPFRSEKDSNWEGAFRVPAMVRWPGRIEPGQISNEMFSGLDWFPTLLAVARIDLGENTWGTVVDNDGRGCVQGPCRTSPGGKYGRGIVSPALLWFPCSRASRRNPDGQLAISLSSSDRPRLYVMRCITRIVPREALSFRVFSCLRNNTASRSSITQGGKLLLAEQDPCTADDQRGHCLPIRP
jgi:Sulfatase